MRMRTKDFFKFIIARQNVYLRRAKGEVKPWTNDKILQQYRFCNVYREQDTVTCWIAEHWRWPHRKERELWFAMVVARLLNLPASLLALGWPVPWKERDFIKTLQGIQKIGSNVFNAAYIVSTNGVSMDKVEYVAECVLTPLWLKREHVSKVIHNETLGTIPPPTLSDVHRVLTGFNGLGSFLAAQVIADLKYVPPLTDCVDWKTWAASGPGSRRGLNRLCDRHYETPWKEAEWLAQLRVLQGIINPMWQYAGHAPLHAQDLQNCLCEFDKYERVRLGQGRPKQKYQGV